MSRIDEFISLLKGRKPYAVNTVRNGRRKQADGTWRPVKRGTSKRSSTESKQIGNVTLASSKNWDIVDSRVTQIISKLKPKGTYRLTPDSKGNISVKGKYRTVKAFSVHGLDFSGVPKTGLANKNLLSIIEGDLKTAMDLSNMSETDDFRAKVLLAVIQDKISIDRIHDISTFAPVGRANPRVVLPTKVKTAKRLYKESKENIVIAGEYGRPEDVKHWKEESRKLATLVRKLEG